VLGLLTPHPSFWDELTDHPQVVWGALLALVIVILLTPAVGGMARLLGVVDRPGGRRLHTRSIPRLGGLALFLGVIVSALAFLDLTSETRGVLLGVAVATTVGAVDDFRGLRPLEKLLGQIAAAVIPVAFGIWIDHFTLPFVGVHSIPGWVGKPLTVIWIVAIMNMVNFLDGLDGLAAGVCAIAGGTFSVIALSLEKPNAAIMSAIVLGACVGFLRHNFYPARIFMGDWGSNLLGFVLATVAVQGLLKTAATVALALPLVVLAVPILDTGFVIAKRLKYSRPITSADREHLHYRFLNIGFSVRRATLTIWFWCATLAAAALGTRFFPVHEHGHWHVWAIVAAAGLGVLALAASLYVVYLLEIVKLANPRIRRRERSGGAASSPPERKSA